MSHVVDGSDLDKIDRYVRAFEIAKDTCESVHIRSFLPEPSDPDFQAVLKELILVEIELDGTRADSGALKKYIDEFPELRDDPGLVAEIEAELRRPSDRSQGFSSAALPRTDTPGRGEPNRTNPNIDRCPAGEPSRAHGRAIPSTPPPAVLPEVGESFQGFRLIEELGRGTFGRVFLASQGELADRPVALKVAVDESDEARTLARLQHTNIVPIYSVHRAPPLIAVCMPYFGSLTFKDIQERRSQSPTLPATGRSLFELASQAPPPSTEAPASEETPVHSLTPSPGPAPLPRPAIESRIQLESRPFDEAILWLFARLAEGLEHAHRRGILHRDIKPANILLTDEGQPMLLDFNLAEDRELAPQSASRMGGTLPYMSPEQLEALLGSGRRIDARSDVFALGVILFELLTGQPPYPRRPGHDAQAVAGMLEDRKAGPPDPRRIDRGIRPATAAIIRKCLEPNPARRYRSAGELLDDLERQLANLPLKHARDRDLPERIHKWVRRHPGIKSLGTLAIASAILVTLLGAGLWIRAERLADIEARDAFDAFGRDLRHASLLLTTADPARRSEAARETRQALDRYRVLDDPGWQDSPRVARLPAASRKILREQVGESLEAMANAIAASAGPAPANPDEIRQAVSLNQEAAACYEPAEVPRSLLLQRAGLLRALGRDAEAKSAEASADSTPVESTRDRLLMARLAIARGEPAEAVGRLRPITQADPKNFWAWYLLAVGYERLQDPTSAERAFTACLSLESGFDEPWYNRGLVRARRGDLAGAHDDLTRAIELNPERPMFFLNRGLVDRARKRFEPALRDVARAIELGAPKAYAYSIKSLIHAESGDAGQAARDRAEGLRHAPDGEDAWVARGLARMAVDPSAAVGDFDEALRLNPRSLPALQNRAAALSGISGGDEEALSTLTRAAALYPDLAEIQSGRARMLAALGRRDQAIEAGDAALSLSHSPHILYQVGCAYAINCGKYPEDRDQALRLVSRALRNGFGHRELPDDEDLKPLRDDPRFGQLLRAAREKTVATEGR